jgi:DUF971 family protein
MLRTIPSEISFDDKNLIIVWKDNFQSVLELLSLRKNCPCAVCRGGDFGKIGTKTGHINSIQLISWRKVGRYALNLSWSDNHDTGIFTYDNLRAYSEGQPFEV